jgi:hypothetical protein
VRQPSGALDCVLRGSCIFKAPERTTRSFINRHSLACFKHYTTRGVPRTRHGPFLDTTPIELASFMTTNGRNHCLRKKDVKALSPRVCLPTLQSTPGHSNLNPQNPSGLQMFADVFFIKPSSTLGAPASLPAAGLPTVESVSFPAGQVKPPPKPNFAIFTTAFTGFLPLFNRSKLLRTRNLRKFTTFYRYFFVMPPFTTCHLPFRFAPSLPFAICHLPFRSPRPRVYPITTPEEDL